jgi:hypothetical protein
LLRNTAEGILRMMPIDATIRQGAFQVREQFAYRYNYDGSTILLRPPGPISSDSPRPPFRTSRRCAPANSFTAFLNGSEGIGSSDDDRGFHAGQVGLSPADGAPPRWPRAAPRVVSPVAACSRSIQGRARLRHHFGLSSRRRD